MRIVIIDDHEIVRRGLAMLLAKLFDEATIEGFSQIPELPNRTGEAEAPDIILLDLLLPGVHAMEGLDTVRRSFPEIPVVIISASEGIEDIAAAIEHGARGYILKSSNEEVLKLAVSLVLSGEIYIPAQAINEQNVSLQSMLKGSVGRKRKKTTEGGNMFPSDNPLGQLTDSEFNVLRLLMRGQSNKEIGRNLDLVEGTVKKYVREIFKTLKVSSRTQAVITAHRLGWKPDDGAAATVPKPGTNPVPGEG